METFFAYFIWYFFIPATAFFTIFFLGLLIDEEFNLGVMDRITDALEFINKKKGN